MLSQEVRQAREEIQNFPSYPMSELNLAPEIGCIYLLQSDRTHRIYVGLTKNLRSRAKEHIRKSRQRKRQAIHHAIAKYGIETFRVYVLQETYDLKESADAEVFWISLFDSAGKNGYNLTIGGEGMSPTPETRRAQSEAIRESHSRPDVIERLRSAAKKRWADPNFRKAHKEGIARGNSNPKTKINRRASRIKTGLVSPVMNEQTGQIFETVTDAARSINRTVALVIHTCKLDDDKRANRASKGFPTFRYVGR